MGILEDVVINAKSAANAVGKSATKLYDLSKLKVSAADLNVILISISRRWAGLSMTENK